MPSRQELCSRCLVFGVVVVAWSVVMLMHVALLVLLLLVVVAMLVLVLVLVTT